MFTKKLMLLLILLVLLGCSIAHAMDTEKLIRLYFSGQQTTAIPPVAPGSALLLESGDYLLLESGDKLLLE